MTTLARLFLQLCEQEGLADPGLALQHQANGFPSLDGIERIAETFQLGCAPDRLHRAVCHQEPSIRPLVEGDQRA
jgi:hypothetical protein